MLTVITPADHHRLTTVSTVKADLGITGNGDDDWLADAIDRASAVIRRWCRRTFAVETVRETFRLDRHRPDLVLSRFPVVTVSAVTVGGTALDASEYEADADKGILYRLDANRRFICWPNDVIEVTYSAGYIMPSEHERTLPEDVEKAAIMLCKVDYFARTRDPLVKAESIEGVIRTDYWVGGFGSGSGLPPDVEMLLQPYRVVTLG